MRSLTARGTSTLCTPATSRPRRTRRCTRRTWRCSPGSVSTPRRSSASPAACSEPRPSSSSGSPLAASWAIGPDSSAAFAAIFPPLWIADGTLVSETAYGFAIALTLLAGHAFATSPHVRSAALLGGAVGLATLGRTEGIGLIVLLILPLAALAREVPWRRKTVLAAAAVAATLVTVSPWVIRNLVQFDGRVYLTDSAGYVLTLGNCDGTYSGAYLGYWLLQCEYSTTSRRGRRAGRHRRSEAGRRVHEVAPVPVSGRRRRTSRSALERVPGPAGPPLRRVLRAPGTDCDEPRPSGHLSCARALGLRCRGAPARPLDARAARLDRAERDPCCGHRLRCVPLPDRGRCRHRHVRRVSGSTCCWNASRRRLCAGEPAEAR